MSEMNIDCNYVQQNFHLHEDGSLSNQERYSIRQHISECRKCREHFEELFYTANTLNNLSSPVPPDGLLEHINDNLENYQKRSLIDWIGYPVARIFSALNLELKPVFVNSSAFVLYIIISLFIVKMFFLFSDSDSIHPTKPIVRPKQRIVTFAEVKNSALSEVFLDIGNKTEEINTNSEKQSNTDKDNQVKQPASLLDESN